MMILEQHRHSTSIIQMIMSCNRFSWSCRLYMVLDLKISSHCSALSKSGVLIDRPSLEVLSWRPRLTAKCQIVFWSRFQKHVCCENNGLIFFPHRFACDKEDLNNAVHVVPNVLFLFKQKTVLCHH